MSDNGFFLGGRIDPATGDRIPGDELRYDPSDLTTHGVIVGMTGSGKTGLGVIFLEEALLQGIPALILDPKGDMTNLALTFPELRPEDFEPWIDPAAAKREGKTVQELARETAELWRNGLASWGIGPERIAELRNRADITIFTPGSTAGTPINIVGSLANPGLDWDTEAEALRDEIQGFVSGLLGLAGITADPISSKEHILLSNLIEHGWRRGEHLDLATLLTRVQRPPMRKLGVFELDTFFPEKERMALAMKLNALVASPSFATWMEGEPLDVATLMQAPDGRPRGSVIYLAHLSDAERQFVVTLLLSKVVTWMRRQAGSGDLRALIYMDEVFGFVPPSAEPPAKKPILTILKQSRAFGVGMLLSTQNPVDLDYKAMSNAGTWCVGRLQTERDKARILEALKSATGATDVAALDAAISGLGKRKFLLHSTRSAEPTIFTTRWAMSYLRGPLTKAEIGRLVEASGPHTTAAAPQPSAINQAPVPNAGAEAAAAIVEGATAGATLRDDETPMMPKVASGVKVRFLDPSAPWAADVGADPTSQRYEAAAAARVELLFDETRAGVDHTETWEAIVRPLTDPFDPSKAIGVDYDERDFTETPSPGARYVIPTAPIENSSYWKAAERALKEHLYRNETITVFRNRALKLYSRVGESRDDFLRRCDTAAQERADAEAAKLRDKYETRIERVKDQLLAAERRIDELEVDLQGKRQQQVIDAAGAVLGVLLGRRSTRSITGSARSRQAARSKEARLRTAQEKAEDKAEELAELEADMREDLEEINDEWETKAEEIEEIEIRLEKTDIAVTDFGLVWIPVPEPR